MEAKLINLEDFEYAGEGANGASYNHKKDSNLMLKLYFATIGRELVEIEVERAMAVYEAGIPSPKPGEFVTDGSGRYGILFRRLVGKVSYARQIGNHPEEAEYYGREFAKIGKEFHSVEVDTSKFPCVKDQYLEMAATNPYISAGERAKLERYIKNAPDTVTAVHGDFHFGNALIVDNESYFIDLGEFAYGFPLFDLGMMMIVCTMNDESFTTENFHMDNATARRVYAAFIEEYFDGQYTVEQANRIIAPFAAIKCLLVERNGCFRYEPMHRLLATLD